MADIFTQLTADAYTLSFDESYRTQSSINATPAFISAEDQVDLGGGYTGAAWWW